MGVLFYHNSFKMNSKKNELVIVGQNNENMLIDARLLHQQLQISTKFSTWIQRRIDEFGFEENVDYFSITEKKRFPFLGNQRGGDRRSIDYHLTMDMAKELAMLERNEVGKRIRQYFIAVEKEARETAGSARLLPKGIHSRTFNGRKIYQYRRLAEKLGYSVGGSIYERKRRYPNHFIELDNVTYCTEEMANLMAMSKSVSRHRTAIKDMQPVLPLDWGTQPLELKGGAL